MGERSEGFGEGQVLRGGQDGAPSSRVDDVTATTVERVMALMSSAPAWEDHLHDGAGGMIAWATPNLRYPVDPVDSTIQLRSVPRVHSSSITAFPRRTAPVQSSRERGALDHLSSV